MSLRSHPLSTHYKCVCRVDIISRSAASSIYQTWDKHLQRRRLTQLSYLGVPGGPYRCSASNAGGESSAELRLIVSTPLHVEISPPLLSVHMGGTAEFRYVDWFRQGCCGNDDASGNSSSGSWHNDNNFIIFLFVNTYNSGGG